MDNFLCSRRGNKGGKVSVLVYHLSFSRKGGCFLSSSLAAIMFLVQSQLFLAILAIPQVVVTQHHECAVQSHGPLNQEWVYTAPARFVPAPPVDPALQADFFRLFTSHDNYTKQATRNEPLPAGISQTDLDFISSVCPKNAFFYSSSPQHVVARDMLQRYLSVQPTPRDVFHVAKILLHNHEINSKIWYYALMGAVMSRPDMAGVVIPGPLDTIPDWFVQVPVLTEILSRYQPVYGVGETFLNYHGPPSGPAPNVAGHPGGNGGGFVPSVGPVRPPPLRNGVISGIGPGLAPLNGIDSGSYQTFSGPLGAASHVNEHKVTYDDSASGSSDNVFDLNAGDGQGGQVNNLGFSKRRGVMVRKRVKVRRRQEGFRERMAQRHVPVVMEDNAGAESISPVQIALPPPEALLALHQTGAGVRRNMNLVVKDEDEITSNNNSYGGNNNHDDDDNDNRAATEDQFYGVTLSYGEEDDEYEELMRIHKTSSNSTRDIRQRILQRRQRRKKKDKERPANKVKRQAYGGGAPVFQQPQPAYQGPCTVINGSIGVDNGEENKLWYFREDILVNSHHWYWHQMYPINATKHGHRRSELFFYVHRNLVARYNAERLSNGMPRTLELILKHGSYIEDGYNSHLVEMSSRKLWTPRAPHAGLTDILHEDDQDFARNIFLKDVYDLYHKLIFSIKDGHLLGANQQPIPIRNVQGIDDLGNTIEATDISVNPLYYDSIGIHNLGHQILGLIQDPQFIAQLPTGVMADTAVTMRDPVFYTFHAGIDNIFDRHKRTLPPYQLYDGDYPLVWPGVAISNVEVVSSFSHGHPNHLKTFYSSNRFPLESGIDNSIHDGSIREDICAVHLNHEPFTYKITINVNPCVETVSRQGTVRIFMAPRFDEYGHRFPLKVQRRLMFQLDVFPVQLQQGRNLILRSSLDSSLTKTWPASLRQQAFGGASAAAGGQQAGAADFCGCGWPNHLLIPKGTPAGMPFDLFVMITNHDDDLVENFVEDLKIPEPCNSPYLFCGVPFRRYPDAKPMGYPFDRLPYKVPARCEQATEYPLVCKMLRPNWYRPVQTLEEYVHAAPNMAARVVVIQHTEHLVN